MAAQHPDELTLLAYVEGDLTAVERGTLAAHVAACPACTEQVRLLEVGREALAAAPHLELPEERRRALLRRLPEHPQRFGFLEPFRHGLTRAAPALAALLLVAVFVAFATQLGDGGDDDAGSRGAAGGGEAAQTAPAQAEGAEEGEEPVFEDEDSRTLAHGRLVRRVVGPPREVVELLRQSGYPAVVQDGAVVAEGRPGELRAVLEGRPRGPVAVYVR
jgi:anti-sigma factor RsiW